MRGNRDAMYVISPLMTTQGWPKKPVHGITFGRVTIRDYEDCDDDDNDHEGNRMESETAQLAVNSSSSTNKVKRKTE